MALDSRSVLVIQFLLSLVAWSAIAVVLVRPLLASLEPRRALRWLLAPQMMRHIGMTLLADGVTREELPAEFVTSVATGDLITMIAATLAFVMLGRPGRTGLVLAAAATIIGAVDLLHNVRLGMLHNAAPKLGAAWFIVSMLVPFMLVAHALAAHRLANRELWRSTP
jgi:hypothetical protein